MTRWRLAIVLIATAAVLLLGGAAAVTAVLLSRRSATDLGPVAGTWAVTQIVQGWTSTNQSATMSIEAGGDVTVTGQPPGYGCIGTARSTGGHKPYKITLTAGCDTGDPAAWSELDATLDATGNQLTLTMTMTNTSVSRWARRA
jgi:hypothetical protein